LVNVRYGHILHALYFVHQKELTFEQIYELGHHLLKANPHKYMPREIAPNMPNDRDAQVKWLQTASGHRLQLVLLYERNIYYPNSKVSRLLLMAGASSTVYFADGDTLLCKYSAGNNAVMIQLLIQYNADVNACNQSNGLTPLMYAVKNKHLQAAQLLLQCGADVTAQDRENKSALIHAASVNSVELFALIFETEWPLEHEQSDDKANEVTRAFQEAVKANNIELCTYILDKTDIPIDLSTALMVACCSRKVDVCSFLLSRGATMKAEQRWEGKSALLCAIQSGLFELTKNLLNTPNLKINTEVTSEGWTPLIMAAHYGHNGLVEELLNQGLIKFTLYNQYQC
jgi:ankyrin repeat protein